MVRLRWARALRAKVQGTSSKACAERCRGIEQSAFGADAKREEASAKFEEASSKFEEASSKACAERRRGIEQSAFGADAARGGWRMAMGLASIGCMSA